MDENKFWLSLWLGLGLMLFATITVCALLSYKNDEFMATKGYCKTAVLGPGDAYWQKCVEVK